MSAPLRIGDRNAEITAGLAALCLGAWWLYDAYDNRGIKRPFWMKLAPGA